VNTAADTHPARLTIDYPDHELDRLSTLLRTVYVIPLAVVLGLTGGRHGAVNDLITTQVRRPPRSSSDEPLGTAGVLQRRERT
jgi:hypothetical protein